jgi:hypothetical protein
MRNSSLSKYSMRVLSATRELQHAICRSSGYIILGSYLAFFGALFFVWRSEEIERPIAIGGVVIILTMLMVALVLCIAGTRAAARQLALRAGWPSEYFSRADRKHAASPHAPSPARLVHIETKSCTLRYGAVDLFSGNCFNANCKEGAPDERARVCLQPSSVEPPR